MKFTKMHGLGNDYVFVDCFEETVEEPAELARLVSDRHQGVGSDGLILLKPSRAAELALEIYNADGSRAQMCGNGIRCVAKYAVEHGLVPGPHVRIETDAGIKHATCTLSDGCVTSVRVDMGVPMLDAAALPTTLPVERVLDYPLKLAGQTYRVTCVSMGNPHAVCFLDDFERLALEVVGPQIEQGFLFPERINVHMVRVDAADHVTVRTWERGSGLTQACGTGACAVCVAGSVTGRTKRVVTVTLPGGDLLVEWADDEHVYLTGPAVEVFTGTWPEHA